MSEDYRSVEVRESLPTGSVGVRVRVRLSGRPSRRWSRGVRARLASELVGYASVDHLHLNEIVQGDEIVLEGVEEWEAPTLPAALQRAIDATNRALAAEPSATGSGDEVKPSSWFG